MCGAGELVLLGGRRPGNDRLWQLDLEGVLG